MLPVDNSSSIKNDFPFIVIEGIDKTGKSTIAKILSEKLNYKLYEYPNRTTPIGKVIDTYLKKGDYPFFEFNNQNNKISKKDIDNIDINNIATNKGKENQKNNHNSEILKNELTPEVANLLFAANRYESATSIIKRDTGIITARYYHSGYAGGLLNNLQEEWVKSCDSLLPRPNYLFFIDSCFSDISEYYKDGDREIYETSNNAMLFYKHLKRVCLEDGATVLKGGMPEGWYVVEILKVIQ